MRRKDAAFRDLSGLNLKMSFLSSVQVPPAGIWKPDQRILASQMPTFKGQRWRALSHCVPLRGTFAMLGLSFPIKGESPPPHTPTPPPLPPAPWLAHLLWKLGSLQQLQGLQVGVEEGAGLQVATQLALHDVAHGAVVRQPDEGRGVHEVGATEGQSHAAATGQRPLIPRALPVSQKTLPPPQPAGREECSSSICPLHTVWPRACYKPWRASVFSYVKWA